MIDGAEEDGSEMTNGVSVLEDRTETLDFRGFICCSLGTEW